MALHDPTQTATARPHTAAEVQRLRGQITRMQRRSAQVDAIPVHDALASLFPDGGLRPGSVYSVDGGTGLLLALMAAPSRAGSWCAAIGMPELAAEAAEGYGVDLERFAMVPSPGDRWLAVTAAVAEVFPVVAVRPSHSARDSETARIGAKLRDRGGVLLVQGRWPQAEATLRLHDAAWSGLGQGHGLLAVREVTVTAVGRRFPVPRSVRVQLPGPLGAPASVVAAVRPAWRTVRRADPASLEAVAG
ncbi:hypothetical protein [Microbacterium marinilacus]|uniref:Protein ImuA n=1 Tax=Microbacterium marinilacus TaxID=415209 RepID=A0ABP7B4U0_9MICO|nr:hypothetical protein [Microbacterium marinilacus]MBY0687842.1 hypothetical protein [Microbacterium marinilacus]